MKKKNNAKGSAKRSSLLFLQKETERNLKTLRNNKQRIARRIEMRFKKKNKGRITIPLKDAILAVEYMYGNMYCLKKKVGKKVYLLEPMARSERIAELIIKEKDDSKNKIYNKLKGLK